MLKSFKPEEILEMRKKEGLSQQELAEEIGVSQRLVSYWERGEREPKKEHQALLAEYIGDKRKFKRKTTEKPKQVIPDIPVEKKLDQLLDVLARYPNPTLHAQAANLFLQIGRPDEALDHILKTLKARPDSPPFLMIQARCFLMKGEFKKAVPILEQLLSLRPYDSNIIARLAQAYHGAGETAQAKELLVSAINRDLERGYKNRFLASILCDMNE
jgi:transcriptional regulator with XRE-family HTH domain